MSLHPTGVWKAAPPARGDEEEGSVLPPFPLPLPGPAPRG